MNQIRPSYRHLLTISKYSVHHADRASRFTALGSCRSHSSTRPRIELRHRIPVNANVRIILAGLDGCDSRIFQD